MPKRIDTLYIRDVCPSSAGKAVVVVAFLK